LRELDITPLTAAVNVIVAEDRSSVDADSVVSVGPAAAKRR